MGARGLSEGEEEGGAGGLAFEEAGEQGGGGEGPASVLPRVGWSVRAAGRIPDARGQAEGGSEGRTSVPLP